MSDKKRYKIEVSKVGTYQASSGVHFDITKEILSEMADNYNKELSGAPFVLGHPKTDDPAYGWVENFSFDGKKLFAEGNVEDVDKEYRDLVDSGKYRKVSLSLYTPDAPNNPVPGKHYPKHVGGLGGMSPAIPLAAMSFSEPDQEGIVEFSYTMGSTIPGILRRLREYILGKEGKETADEVIPNWEIDSVIEQNKWDEEREKEREKSFIKEENPERQGLREFSETIGEDSMSDNEKLNVELQGENERLKAQVARLQEKESIRRAESIKDFSEKLVAKGVKPAGVKKLTSIITELESDQQVFSFSEGNEVDVAGEIMSALEEAVADIIDFSEKSKDEGDDDDEVSFSAPVGVKVDKERLALMNKAEKLAKEKGIELVDALEQVGA